MADLHLKSERQIQTEMLATFIASVGLNDINPGSVIDLITQAAAQQDFAQYYQLAQVSRLVNLDALSGTDLENRASDFGVTRRGAAKATGLIDILRETGFVKVSTSIYTGTTAPFSGNLTLNVVDASNALYASSGTLIIGRGTNNEEEVAYSVAPVLSGGFYTFTLDTALTNNHLFEESVILKQGLTQFIAAGTIVVVEATGTSEELRFETVNDVTLLAGEDKLANVEVIAILDGTSGNIPVSAISGTEAFPTPPFTGARAFNGSKFTTGSDLESDEALRDRVKSVGDTLTRGVRSAILNAVVGLVDPISAKRVVSASVVLPVDVCGVVKVYIDDGVGFEPDFSSVGIEVIRLDATGGESLLQLDNFPLLKALIESNNEGPLNYGVTASILDLKVGDSFSESITIDLAAFSDPTQGTMSELAAHINNKSKLVEARTSRGGRRIVLTARTDINDNIQITGGTANSIIGFPTLNKETLNLYIDDIKVHKDGAPAILEGNVGPYDLDAVGASPWNLILEVDGKAANAQTATLDILDVVDQFAVTPLEIVTAINAQIAGVIAKVDSSGTKVLVESCTKDGVGSKLRAAGGTINTALGLSTTEVIGKSGDFKLNKELGLIELVTPLNINQTVTAGSLNTKAHLQAVIGELYAPANGTTLVVSVDGGGLQTITFDATFGAGKTAQATADFINLTLVGGFARVVSVGSTKHLVLETNTLDGGSIRITSASTGNAPFGFTLNVLTLGEDPSVGFKKSVVSTPYNFRKDDSLVIIIDNDTVNNTFTIGMSHSSSLTGVVSSSVFSDTTLIPIHESDGIINGFQVAATSGVNSDVVAITDVTAVGFATKEYVFSIPLATFANYAVGDLVTFTGMSDATNNGNFIITAIDTNKVSVSNDVGVVATGQTGAGLICQKREVSGYVALTGEITTSVAFSSAPTSGDTFILLPRTVGNVVYIMNNLKLSGLSLKARVESVDSNTKVQISSLKPGSDGSVQVSGGSANVIMKFDTTLYKGVAAYNYYTGLLDLVHRTIYGDDSDLVTFPGVGAAGVNFEILAPTIQEVRVEITTTLSEGISLTSVDNEIKSAVTGYVNSLGVGDDVVLERIRAEVIKISGISDVSLSSPTVNLAIADNELARISNTDIIIG